MTSNQISNALAIETQRHNVEQEDIEREKNRLQAIRNDNDKAYQEASNAITKQYNDKYLEIQQSQGDERLRLEAELNSIKQEQQNLDQWYKTESIALNKSNTEIAAKQQVATEEYQKRLNELGYEKNQIERYATFVNEKWNEYQTHSIDLTHAENQLSMQIAHERNAQQYEVEMLNISKELERIKLDAQAALLQAEVTKRGQNTQLLNGLLISTGNLLKTISSKLQ